MDIESQSERLIRVESKLDNLCEEFKDFKKILLGNGKQGFVKEVEAKFDRNDKEVQEIKLKMAENKGAKKVLLSILGSGMLASIITTISIKFLVPIF